ncbi:MAG: hypothetical protein ACOC82_01290 [Candidatus Bipolaricaulota bacterium]
MSSYCKASLFALTDSLQFGAGVEYSPASAVDKFTALGEVDVLF